jgi:hypothetical protein
MNNSDHISESLETIFWIKILKFFDADPGSGMEKFGLNADAHKVLGSRTDAVHASPESDPYKNCGRSKLEI